MSLCDPYKELELYLEQANDDITRVFEDLENSPPAKSGKPAADHKFAQENDKLIHGFNKRPQSNCDADTEAFLTNFDNTIANEIAELIERSKLRHYKDNVQSEHNDDFFNTTNGVNYQNGSAETTLDENDLDQSSTVEFSESCTTLSSGKSQDILVNNDLSVNTATQTSPTVSHSSSLTWASDYCSSSPCLTSDHDAIDEDNLSSSSTDCTELTPQSDGTNNWIRRRRWPQGPPVTVDLGNKSSSAPVLKKAASKVSKQTRSQSDRHLAEIEATEACKWLRAAGFPQYAQLYEDMKFPMDVLAVQQDHPLLEKDLLSSLYRRLWVLNQCARVHQQRATQTDDSEDEQCALSGNWTYLAESGRWSRVGNGQNLPFPTADDCTTKDWWTTSLPHSKPNDVPENLQDSLLNTIKRTVSLKPNRRRDGFIMSDCGSNVLDLLAKQVREAGPTSRSSEDGSDLERRRGSQRRRNFSESLDRSSDNSVNLNVNKVPHWEDINRQPIPNMSIVEEVSGDGFSTPIAVFSCGQLQVLRKVALLKLTSLIEHHCPNHRSGWNWELPKFFRKLKGPAYKDKFVFGVPLSIIQHRSGQALPKTIQFALQWLRHHAFDQEGLFRKSGVKSQIQTLRSLVESEKPFINFGEHQPYVICDLIKQYFRDLPESLLTSKLSETLIMIFQLEVPASIRKQALLCTLLLLPDEHCEALQVILDFLYFIAKHSDVNKMTVTNLAMCFAPSLFHMNQISPNRQGMLGPRQLAETQAARDCLEFMITNTEDLFKVPQDLLVQCSCSKVEDSKAVPLSKLGEEQEQDWRGYLNACMDSLLKEVRDRGRAWISLNSSQPRVDLAYKKIADNHPLRLWRASAEIEAPPSEVLHRILRERHLWDEELHSTKIVVQLDTDTEIFQYVRNMMAPLLAIDYCVLRTWCTTLYKGACAIVETSVEHPEAPCRPNSVRGIVLVSRYLIEPCGSGHSRLLHFSRVECKGKTLEWYHKTYGHLCALLVMRIQASFQHTTSGPESKV